MLKKLTTILFLLVMTVGIYTQSISSGTARYQALGYNPFIMDAATDINRNPAWAGVYRNYSFGDIGTVQNYPGNNTSADNFVLNDQYAGINFGISKPLTLGLILNNPEGMWSSFNDGNVNITASDVMVNSPIVPLKILASWSTKTLNIGLAPYLAMWSKETTSSPTGGTTYDSKQNSSTIAGTLGAIYHMKNENWIEGNFDLRFNSFKFDSSTTNPATGTTVDNKGGTELGATVRGWFQVNKQNKINLVPYITFSTYSWQPEVITTPTATTSPMTNASYLILMGGVGINMPILDDGMLAGGISVGINNSTYTHNDSLSTIFKISNLILPQFNLGMEWNLTDWLVGRAGYSRNVTKTKDDYSSKNFSGTTTQQNPSNPDQTITLGVGFLFNRFSLDGLIGEKWLQAGPWVLSGNSTDMFGVISVSYNFAK